MIADHVLKRIGRGDLERRSVGLGDPEKGGRAGKLNADWSQVDLTGLDLNNIDVPHTLGVVPTTCDLKEWVNDSTPSTFLIARPVDKHLWTGSNCRVSIVVQSGAQAGTVARFLVG
ncbi:MAG: hypothetical protein ACRD2A_25005, partial [Vicinamibacterales bacterium]